jgi:SAM-dependent methyltransferase
MKLIQNDVIIVLLSIVSSIQAFLTIQPKLRKQSFQRAAETTLEENKKTLLTIFDGQESMDGNIYASPESLQSMSIQTRYYGFVQEKFFIDNKFNLKYAIYPDKYADLVAPVGEVDASSTKLGQKIFQTNFMSSIYERGYRQNFESYGFPGIEKEFEEAKDYFLSHNNTDIVLDLSCGSGFMTRKYLKSGLFARVIAADLSPTMLIEARRNCIRDEQLSSQLPEFVRCDSAKLPFRSNSISAIHAGAAMHCWPEVQLSVNEIYRVLKPGGSFYATTFFQHRWLGRSTRNQGFSIFKSSEEIQGIIEKAGFEKNTHGGDNEVRREGSRCVVV